MRQKRTAPLLSRVKTGLDNAAQSLLPKERQGEPIRYTLKHWTALTGFIILAKGRG